MKVASHVPSCSEIKLAGGARQVSQTPMAGPKGELLPFVKYSEHNREVQEVLSV